MKKRPAPPCLPHDYYLIDSHCHLDMDAYKEDIGQIIQMARDAGVRRIITIGIDLASSSRAVSLAEAHADVFATVGIHPHAVEEASDSVYKEISSLAKHPKVVGFGEIGLDYAKQYAPIKTQQQEFERQLHLAKELQLPVIIHDREAHDDTLRLLKENSPFPAGGVMHCFSGNILFAEKVLELGFFISIPGIVTFKNAIELQQVVQHTALDRMLLETDGPFLAPVPWRGKTNRPDFLLYTAAKVAALKNTSLENVARQCTKNTESLFNLNPMTERDDT